MVKKADKLVLIVMIAVASIMGAGCAQSKNNDSKISVNEQPMDSAVVESEIAVTNESSTENPSKEESSTAEPSPVTPIDAAVANPDGGSDPSSEKHAVIDQLKKQAEENADKDRDNIIECLDNAESDERWSAAIGFIKHNYPDYFSSEELLLKSIEYGHYLVSLYKDSKGVDNGRGRYYEMGELVSVAAQNVYLGIHKSTDEFILEKMQKLEEQLEFFYDKYYGK